VNALARAQIRRSPAPNWVLRTAIGPASMAGQLAVRGTGAQHQSAEEGRDDAPSADTVAEE